MVAAVGPVERQVLSVAVVSAKKRFMQSTAVLMRRTVWNACSTAGPWTATWHGESRTRSLRRRRVWI